MPQKSSIKTLPQEVLARLNFLLTEGALTLDQVTAWLDEAGHPRSRSSVHRYKEKLDKVADKLRQSRDITDALVRELGDSATQGKQGRLLVEMARSVVFDLLMKMQEEGDDKEPISTMDVAMLGKGLAEMARAARLDQDFETKIAEQVEKRTKVAAASAAESAAKEAGLSSETAAMIKAKILGVKVER